MLSTCPYCGEDFEARGMDGHLRLAHGGEETLEDLLQALRLRNRAVRSRDRLGEIPVDSRLHADARIKCDRLARRAGERLEHLLDSIRSEG